MTVTIPITNCKKPASVRVKRIPRERVHVVLTVDARLRIIRLAARATEVCKARPSISALVNLAVTYLDKVLQEDAEYEAAYLRRAIKVERNHNKPKARQ